MAAVLHSDLFRCAGMVAGACLLQACSGSLPTNPGDAKPFDPHALDRGLARLNPSPQQAYEITLTIDNAPGPFAVVEGTAQFDVTNKWECGRIDPVRGTPNRITSLEPFILEKESSNVFKGVVYLDYMVDEAYFDRAVCHWQLNWVSGFLRATNDETTTRFLPGLNREQVLAQASKTTYFWRGGYPRSRSDDFADYGHADIGRFKPEIRDDLFTITLNARKVN